MGKKGGNDVTIKLEFETFRNMIVKSNVTALASVSRLSIVSEISSCQYQITLNLYLS